VKYDFGFSWDSTYGYAARLVDDNVDTGLVVDLGCGLASFSQPLVELGFEYQGFDYDAASVAECQRRGIACESIDLHDMGRARDIVLAAIGDRRVVAVSLLDVVEHLPDPASVLAGVAALLDALASDGHVPLLVMSIPNVAHADLAAKLALGRWDVTETGLLDATHITLFTHDRLIEAVDAAGLVEVGRNDVVFADTEQRFPADHPAVADGTPLRNFLRSIRLHADPFGHTYQFVRCYRRVDVTEMTTGVDHVAPRCTVIVPTVGDVELSATLSSLAAQTETDLEIRLVYPARFAEQVAEQTMTLTVAVRERVVLDEFDTGVDIDVDQRIGLLNLGLGRATGDLVAFAEEGDVLDTTLIADMCATADQHPGQMVRAGAGAPFDPFRHLVRDETPLSSVLVPRRAVTSLGLRFAAVGGGFEVWDFVARAASMIGVVHCHVDVVAGAAGGDVPTAVSSSMDAEQFLLPAGSVATLRRAAMALVEQDRLTSELAIARQRIEALERSRYWRVTAPVRKLTSKRPSLRPWRSPDTT